ncbi:hypothetical protein HF576_12755 [Microbacterium sp. CFH 90308]|uniref:Uncharacterized protein n=1 Tax=Microbacterium salsuginis TaxID=2722803 RepID=A0ABX1KCG0_9MICO|nr:hypothetical protein [Microbacterium sp. CFH 90308]NLP84722.1 hypothetical protein [Microbacterium sp. CFH 90308]
MTDQPDDELRALRERAYGRHADIHEDPAAMARLRELEARARVSGATPESEPVDAAAGTDATSQLTATAPALDGTGATPASASYGAAPAVSVLATPLPAAAQTTTLTAPPDGAHPDAAEAVDATASPAAPSPEALTPVRPWWRRRMPLLWVGSLAAAVLLGVGLTLAVQELSSGTVAVLHEDAEMEWPSEIGGSRTDGSRGFDSFYGLAVISQLQQMGPAETDAMECLSVFSGRGDSLFYAGGACGTGPFPATATAIVGAQSPEELRGRFADGTVLQFVLDGDEVRVFAAAPAPVPALDDGDEPRTG